MCCCVSGINGVYTKESSTAQTFITPQGKENTVNYTKELASETENTKTGSDLYGSTSGEIIFTDESMADLLNKEVSYNEYMKDAMLTYVKTIKIAEQYYTDGFIYHGLYSDKDAPASGYSLENEQYVKDLALSITKDAKTDKEKVNNILKWTYANFRYGYSGYAHFQTAYNAIKQGSGVCEDFTLIVKELCIYSGIRCLELFVDPIGHQVNLIQADGTWYYVDPTGHSGLMDAETAYKFMNYNYGGNWIIRISAIRHNSENILFIDNKSSLITRYEMAGWGYANGKIVWYDSDGTIDTTKKPNHGWISTDNYGACFYQNGLLEIGSIKVNNKTYDLGYHGWYKFEKPLARPIEDGSFSIGDTAQLDVVFDYNDKNEKANLQWTSSDPDIIKVDQNGKITVVDYSEKNICITVSSATGFTSKIYISAHAPYAYIELNTKERVLDINQSYRLKANVMLSGACDDRCYYKLNWSSSNPKVAQVDQSGKVTAKTEGYAYIYAKTLGESANCLIYVTKPGEIRITNSEIEVTKNGTVNLKAILSPTITSKKILWRVGNSKVATVNQSGKITGKTLGNTYVYAKAANGKEAKRIVKVKPAAQSVKINFTSKQIKLKNSYTFKATVYPGNASQAVTWRTGNANIATVDKNGKVTAKAAGNTWLYAKTKNGKEVRCLIQVVVPATSISFDTNSRTMSAGSSYQFKVTKKPGNATSAITWRTGNSKVATVDKNGKVTAKSAGNTWLYAKTSNGLEAKTLIKVIPAATGVSFDESSVDIMLNYVHNFKVSVYPDNASQAVSWRTGNKSIASVDQNGRVVTYREGSTWLYAKTGNGKEAKCLIKVVIPIVNIELGTDQRTMSLGSVYQFKPQLSPSDATSTITWSTGNKKVATVDRNGKVTAVGVGNTWLYARSMNGIEAKVLIKVIPAASSLSINESAKDIQLGDTYTFHATVKPSNASQSVTWSTGNNKVATVDKTGKVSATGKGSTWLYAKTWNGIEAKCLITVY